MVQVFFVMLFFPVIMNALQYYIIDGFIKDQKLQDHEAVPSEDSETDDLNHGHARRQEDEWDASFDSADESDAPKKPARTGSKANNTKKHRNLKDDPKEIDEYNPERDGESSPTVVGSTSTSPPKMEEEESLLSSDGGKDSQRRKR